MLAGLNFILGLVVVTLGAFALVEGAAKAAAKLNVSPVLIGLLVVGLGTSMPEVALTVLAVSDAQPDLAVGNIVGSNIFNLLLVLGGAALVTPLIVAQQIVRLEVPLLIVVSLAVWGASLDGKIDLIEGAALAVTLTAYLAVLYMLERKTTDAVREEYAAEFAADHASWRYNLVFCAVLVIAGIAALVFGASICIDAGVEIARSVGVSEAMIGLTLLAAGTSVPEAATSLVAALRGERDIAVANAVGSSLFNLLFVLSIAAVMSDGGVAVTESIRGFDMLVMVGASVLCLPLLLTHHRIDRWEGAVLLGAYLAYMGWAAYQIIG